MSTVLNPIIAAAAMSLSSLSVIANSATLKRLYVAVGAGDLVGAPMPGGT